MLFLDEVDELGLDEQALLLQAIETGRYYSLGSDAEVRSRVQVLATATHDLTSLAAARTFRLDFVSRLNIWTFHLPALRDRGEVIEANLRHELAKAEQALETRVGFNADAAEARMRFARAPGTAWPGNFRDSGGSVLRLFTLAPRGRITLAQVRDEIDGLVSRWKAFETNVDASLVAATIDHAVDAFDIPQLANVIRTCQSSTTLSEAGRKLFAVSQSERTTRIDADRLRKYLARFNLSWKDVAG